MISIEALRRIAHIFSFPLIDGYAIDCQGSHLYRTVDGVDIFCDELLVDWNEVIADMADF